MYYRQTELPVVLAPAASVRVWDKPTSMPLYNITIALNSQGALLQDIDWEVFYGGRIDASGVHSGGVSQGVAVNLTGEIAHLVYEETKSIPANSKDYPTRKFDNWGGFPIVLELTNNAVVATTIWVTFVSENVGYP